MAKKKEQQTRYIWVKDNDLSVVGFDDHAAAERKRRELEGTLALKKDRNGDPVDVRLRVRFRSRTGKFDVLVKVKTEAKPDKPKEEGVPGAAAQ